MSLKCNIFDLGTKQLKQASFKTENTCAVFKKTHRNREQYPFGLFYEGLIDDLHA